MKFAPGLAPGGGESSKTLKVPKDCVLDQRPSKQEVPNSPHQHSKRTKTDVNRPGMEPDTHLSDSDPGPTHRAASLTLLSRAPSAQPEGPLRCACATTAAVLLRARLIRQPQALVHAARVSSCPLDPAYGHSQEACFAVCLAAGSGGRVEGYAPALVLRPWTARTP